MVEVAHLYKHFHEVAVPSMLSQEATLRYNKLVYKRAFSKIYTSFTNTLTQSANTLSTIPSTLGASFVDSSHKGAMSGISD